MSADWAPGDVALVRFRDLEECIALWDGQVWRAGDGQWGDGAITCVRPLVVLDPEDTEQVERLAAAYHSVDHKIGTRHLAAALREFATSPPMIAQPSGLGAVVEGESGHLFTRRCICGAVDDWCANCSRSGAHAHKWEDIKAIRVLSQGVTL